MFQSFNPVCDPPGVVDELTSMGLPHAHQTPSHQHHSHHHHHHNTQQVPRISHEDHQDLRQLCGSAPEVREPCSPPKDLNHIEVKPLEAMRRSACSGSRSPRSSLNGIESSVGFVDEEMDEVGGPSGASCGQQEQLEMTLAAKAAMHLSSSPLLR